MRKATTLAVMLLFLSAGSALGQSTEYVFSPERTGQLTDPFPVGAQNGARGLSGPWDLDRDGKIEILVAQHNGAGGRVHVLENNGVDTWELVYSTAMVDSSASSSNARYATAADLDGDGNWEIVYVAGTGYSDANPDLVNGVYVWEHDGVVGSDNYGTLPATIGNFFELDGLEDSFVRSQNLEAMDIDGDGVQELLVPADGASDHDIFYILSVSGTFETNGVGSGFETWVIEARLGPRDDGNAFGGGSPYDIIAADMNGDGQMDLSFHSWNFFNFFNATVTGVDEIAFPDPAAPNHNLQASAPEDQVALFGGIAYDIDQDGNSELFYPNWFTKAITVIDYDAGDDVFVIDESKVALDAIPIDGAGGISVGDIDNDGNMELIVGGNGYQADDWEAGIPSHFIAVAEYVGGDPKDGNSYSVELIDTGTPIDTLGFNIVHRDSLGTMTTFFETAQSKFGATSSNAGDPMFVSGIAYLGDADGDDNVEIAVSFQGVDDSLYVYDEVWNTDSLRFDRTVRERMESPIRSFVRIISMDGLTVKIEDERVVLPSDYVLEQNYPNPFNPSTTIRFSLPLDKNVSVKVYDVAGRLVRTLVNDRLLSQGAHEVTWDGTNDAGVSVASGTYLYSLEYGNFRQTKTMVLLK